MKVERSIDIAATPREIYRVVMDAQRLGDWVSIHRELKEAPDGELAAGSKLTQSLKVAGQTFTVHWIVVKDDCPHRVVWEGKGPVRTKAKVVYDLTENGDSTTFRYANEYELPGGPAGKLAGRAVAGSARRETERSLKRLKSLVERR